MGLTCSDSALDIIDNLPTLLDIFGIIQTVFLPCKGFGRPFTVRVDAEFLLQSLEFCFLRFLLSLFALWFVLDIFSKPVG